MRVLDHEPHSWFLLEDGDTLYFDANCNHGIAGFDVLIALDPAEASAYTAAGRGYLDQLARDIQYSAPGVVGSTSPFTSRDLRRGGCEEGKKATAAVVAWHEARRGQT
jgi:hypothetical protein